MFSTYSYNYAVVVSNTATAAMMFPVARAVLDQFERGRHAAGRSRSQSEPETQPTETLGNENNGEAHDNLKKILSSSHA